MENWEQFKEKIRQWVQSEITDNQFYNYCFKSQFENPMDRKLADIFLKQRENETT